MTTGYIEKSYTTTEADIEKINTFTRREFDADSLYVFTVSLCNNDIDRDNEKFSLASLERLAELFVGKTGISDHSMKSSDQRARIFETWVEKCDGKKTADGEDFYELKAKAYMVKSEENMPFITEIDAGIKKEVSVSCSARKALCSICGTDKRKNGCEHISGREYDGKTAFITLDDIADAYEFSFVAVPAQKEAGVTKAFEQSGGTFENMTDAEEIIKAFNGAGDKIVLTKRQAEKIAEYAQNLEDEAKLGREYRKQLASEVIGLCAAAMPQMDIKTFGSVAQVMTVKELLSFKKAFSANGASAENSPRLQIKSTDGEKPFDQFKL